MPNKYADMVNRIHGLTKRVSPCFMTGKPCTYEESIDDEIVCRRTSQQLSCFSIIPFRPNAELYLCDVLSPYLHILYGIDVEYGNKIGNPGLVICEGICKRIQSVDLVTVDISLPSPNVFYELGLALGIGHKVFICYQSGSEFGKSCNDYFNGRAYAYHDLSPIDATHDLPSWLWSLDENDENLHHTGVVILNATPNDSDSKDINRKHEKQNDVIFSIESHLLHAVGLSFVRICRQIKENYGSHEVVRNYLNQIEQLRFPRIVDIYDSFEKMKNTIDSAYCLIVRTGGQDINPLSYFWLGYCHGRGKNSIPFSVLPSRQDAINDFVFDMRALRYMVLIREQPESLKSQLQETIERMVYADFSFWARKRFWHLILGRRGSISIFTGALHSSDQDREMIGEWDLRAVSELARFFNQQQSRASIETPIYQPAQSYTNGNAANRPPLESYLRELEELIRDRNCIVIGSADVNPLTEFVLGRIYNIPIETLFSNGYDALTTPHAMVSFKELPNARKGQVKRIFAREEAATELSGQVEASQIRKRGFRSRSFPDAGVIMASFPSESELGHDEVETFGHLVIMRNPFGTSGRYIIVLNGVSGPATFALTHVLTGGAGHEFTDYRSTDFNPAVESERVLRRFLSMIPPLDRFAAIQCIVRVKVGAGRQRRERGGMPYDERRILSWIVEEDRFWRVEPREG